MFPTEQPFASIAREIQMLTDPDAKGHEIARIRKRIADDLVSGDTSLRNLAEVALEHQPGTDKLLLLVDQWEELYSLCKSDEIRQKFIDELITATAMKDSPLQVVLTVRDDYYGTLLKNNELMEQIGEGRVDVSPMKPAELEEVIQRPADSVGLQIKPSLIREIRDDASGRAGKSGDAGIRNGTVVGKTEPWRASGIDFRSLYTQIGKLAGAIATHAQSVYENRLTQEEREKLPGLFRKLVNAGASSKEDTRRRVRLQELDPTTRSAASKLADERLLIIGSRDMSTNGEVDSRHDNGDDAARFQDSRADSKSNRDRQTVEVAHEELLRRWTLLVKWIDEDRRVSDNGELA